MKTIDMEIAVSSYLNIRRNLIVPNISWGIGIHECDLLVITKSGYGWEIEIKVSKSDLIKDKKKKHGHYSEKIKNLYFAIPYYLEPYIEHIPERAGIIVVNKYKKCKIIRKSKNNGKYKFTDKEKYKVACLGAMRIWGLKQKLSKKIT